MTQSRVPYVAVPFAMGFVAVGATPVRAGLLGALSSVMLIVVFYAVSPFDTGGYAVDTTSIYYEYGPIGVITGFTLAVLSRSIARKTVEAPVRRALACCSILTLALIPSRSASSRQLVSRLPRPPGGFLLALDEAVPHLLVQSVVGGGEVLAGSSDDADQRGLGDLTGVRHD